MFPERWGEIAHTSQQLRPKKERKKKKKSFLKTVTCFTYFLFDICCTAALQVHFGLSFDPLNEERTRIYVLQFLIRNNIYSM